MTIVSLPPDGATKRFKASQENAIAQQQVLTEGAKDSRKKIEIANAIKSLKEHGGWKIIELWYTTKWSFRNIMNEFRNNKDAEAYKQMMVQRETIEMLEERMNRWIQEGEQAVKQLELEEKSKSHK